MIKTLNTQEHATSGTIYLIPGINHVYGTKTLSGGVTFAIQSDPVDPAALGYHPQQGDIIVLISNAVITPAGNTVTFMGTALTDNTVESNYLAVATYDTNTGGWIKWVTIDNIDGNIQEDMIASEAVTLAKVEDVARGSLITGQTASNRPTALDVKAAGTLIQGDGTDIVALVNSTAGQIIVGDGTKSASVALSGDATLASGGALSLGSPAITGQTEITTTATDDLIIVSDASDSGNLKKVQLTNLSGLKLLHTSYTTVSTDADTVEKDLVSYTLPANTIDGNGQAVYIKAYGTTAANGNTKTIKLYVGATVQDTSAGVSAPNNQSWTCEAWFIRFGTAQQKGWVRWSWSGQSPASAIGTFSDTEDFAADMTLKITGLNGTSSSGDIVLEGWSVTKEA